MRSLIIGILLILCSHSALLIAQQVRTEVVKATTPEEDAKSNSDSVPEVIAITGAFDHIEVLRFKFGTDLLTGLEKKVNELGISDGVILAGIGSVRNYHYHSVSNRDFPSKNIYIKDPEAPADIAGMNGYIIDGRVHSHITFTADDRAFGGHLEQGTNVFTFAIITIGVFKEGMDLSRCDDKTYR